MENLVDVIEVTIKGPREERIMAVDLTEEQADTFIRVAIARRGVETHFYITRPAIDRTGMVVSSNQHSR